VEKNGWLSSQFVLWDATADRELRRAERSGLFTSSWDLELYRGAARLEREGWFGTAYVVREGGDTTARAERFGCCERGWYVEGDDDLTDEDLLLIGLVYHTILQRQARQHHHPGPAAGS